MEHKIISAYCIIEDSLKKAGKENEVGQSEVSRAEVLILGYIGVMFFGGNWKKAYDYAMEYNLIPKIDYSRYIRRLNNSWGILHIVQDNLRSIFNYKNPEKLYIIDSFPVEMCKLARVNRAGLYTEEGLIGYNHITKSYFCGLKVHVVVSGNGEVIYFRIKKASESDVTVAKEILKNFTFPQNSLVVGDKGYISKELKEELLEFGILYDYNIRKNMTSNPKLEYSKQRFRKRIETTFSSITSNFGRNLKAVSHNGLYMKISMFLISFNFDMLLV
jgi:hypothetical protein